MLQKKVFHSYDYTQPRNPFAEIQLITAERDFDKLYVVDWNSDGLPDLQVVHYGVFGEEFTGCVFGGHPNGGHYQQIQRLDLMHNSHMGMFENTDFGSRPQRQRLSVGDWNGGGLLDVVVSPAIPYSLAVSRPTVLENHPEGARQVVTAFQNVTATYIERPYHYEIGYRFAIADFDGNGELDLIIANVNDGKLHYYQQAAGSLGDEEERHPFSNITVKHHRGQ